MDYLVNLSVLSHVALTKSNNFTGILFKVTCRISAINKKQTFTENWHGQDVTSVTVMDNFLAGRFRDPLNSPGISTQLSQYIQGFTLRKLLHSWSIYYWGKWGSRFQNYRKYSSYYQTEGKSIVVTNVLVTL